MITRSLAAFTLDLCLSRIWPIQVHTYWISRPFSALFFTHWLSDAHCLLLPPARLPPS
jgi:hypothetical protein